MSWHKAAVAPVFSVATRGLADSCSKSDNEYDGFADLFLHPTYLVTSPFFTNKNVTVVQGVVFGGRDAWELEGTQVASDPQVSPLGNRWRMWVDKETGEKH